MLESARRKFQKHQRPLPAFLPAGKSCKPISRNYTCKTAWYLDLQVACEAKVSIAWEPLRCTTCLPLCSNAQRVHQPPGLMIREWACGVTGWWPWESQGIIFCTTRSSVVSFGGPKKSPGLFTVFQSTHKLHDTIWSQMLCPVYDIEGNGMNSNLLK